MIVSYRRRLEKLSSQLMPKSNGNLEAAKKLDDYIRKAVPAEWEWILKEEINLSVTAYPNSDPELTILHFKQRMALAVACSRGWMVRSSARAALTPGGTSQYSAAILPVKKPLIRAA